MAKLNKNSKSWNEYSKERAKVQRLIRGHHLDVDVSNIPTARQIVKQGGNSKSLIKGTTRLKGLYNSLKEEAKYTKEETEKALTKSKETEEAAVKSIKDNPYLSDEEKEETIKKIRERAEAEREGLKETEKKEKEAKSKAKTKSAEEVMKETEEEAVSTSEVAASVFLDSIGSELISIIQGISSRNPHTYGDRAALIDEYKEEALGTLIESADDLYDKKKMAELGLKLEKSTHTLDEIQEIAERLSMASSEVQIEELGVRLSHIIRDLFDISLSDDEIEELNKRYSSGVE